MSSALSGAAQTCQAGEAISFRQTSPPSDTDLGGAGDALVLGASKYHKITVGLNVQTYFGDPVVELYRDGAATGISFPIKANGVTSVSWVASYPAGTTLQFKLVSGKITLAQSADGNAYAEVIGYY
jgi:hypothetical protein